MATPLDDRLAEIESRYEAVSAELSSPDVANDQERMRDLGRSFSELQEIVTPYREYRQVLAQAAEARQMEAAESEPEMAAFFRDEADRAEGRADELRGALELLLIPKDPNDGKNVIVEIRAGTGGQEAALWAAELLDMYRRYAERHRWKTELLSTSESEGGGLKEAVMEVRGKDAYTRHEARIRRPSRATCPRHRVPGTAAHVDGDGGRVCRRPRRWTSRSGPRTCRSTCTGRPDRAASR